MAALLVEGGLEVVPQDLVAPAAPAAELLVCRIGRDPVHPAAESRVTLEGPDLARGGPQRVLRHLLRILLIAGDADGQAIDAVSIGVEQQLGGHRIAPA